MYILYLYFIKIKNEVLNFSFYLLYLMYHLIKKTLNVNKKE